MKIEEAFRGEFLKMARSGTGLAAILAAAGCAIAVGVGKAAGLDPERLMPPALYVGFLSIALAATHYSIRLGRGGLPILYLVLFTTAQSPNVFLLLVELTTTDGAAAYNLGPVGNSHFLFILLTAFVLDYRFTLISGAVSALSQAALFLFFIRPAVSVSGIPLTDYVFLNFAPNLSRSVLLILFTGIVAYVTHSLRAVFLKLLATDEVVETQYRRIREHRRAEEELTELNQSKDRFLSIISHDIKSPFAGLRDHFSYIRAHRDELDRDELLALVDTMDRSGEQVNRLVDGLLDWSRIQMGRMPVEPEAISPDAAAMEVGQLFRLNLEQKDLRFLRDANMNLRVRADRRIFSTILRNLISNAVKFTPRGGLIRVIAREGIRETVELRVEDSGRGMDALTRARLLETHPSQANANRLISTPGTRGEQGAGLGLMITRELVELSGGSLDILSEPEGGTVISVSLPAA